MVLNILELNLIAPINGVFMDKFIKIKMGFNRSLHTKFFIEIVDSSLYFYICKLESDNLETL